MRIQELIDNNFIKETDNVERYLLDIIKQYFNSNNIDDDSTEYIIQKAVQRMKTELNIDNAGVVSVNGKTGNVNITLESLGGEPLILPKLSAFNVNFGDKENTACMGNDPRLNDNRHPLPHTHDISEINGLSGELSTIKNNMNLLGNETHKHDNLKILNMITYTGNNSEINLNLLDNAEGNINAEITKIDDIITKVQTDLEELMNQTKQETEQYNTDYDNIKTYIDEKKSQLETDNKKYCDDTMQTKKDEITTMLTNKISKTQLSSILDILNQQFTVLYETNITGFITSNNSSVEYIFDLPADIINTLSVIGDKKYKIDFYFNYTDPVSNKSITTNLPFVYVQSGKLIYTIKGELVNSSSIRITSNKDTNSTWQAFVDLASIKVRISVKNNLEV